MCDHRELIVAGLRQDVVDGARNVAERHVVVCPLQGRGIEQRARPQLEHPYVEPLFAEILDRVLARLQIAREDESGMQEAVNQQERLAPFIWPFMVARRAISREEDTCGPL